MVNAVLGLNGAAVLVATEQELEHALQGLRVLHLKLNSAGIAQQALTLTVLDVHSLLRVATLVVADLDIL